MSSLTFLMVLWRRRLRGVVHRVHEGLATDRVDPVAEADDALDLRRLPRLHRLERAHEHLVEAQRVGAVLPHDVVGVDDVAARLRHLLVVLAEDHPLVDELHERLGVLHEAEVEEHLVPEARVEQVQHRVLGAADVEVDRHPRVVRLLAQGSSSFFGSRKRR